MGELAQTVGLFHLLGNSTKLRLLKMLESGEGYSSELSVIVNLSRSTTTRYLNDMAAAGLLKTRKTGYRIYFYLTPANTFEGKIAKTAVSRLTGNKTVVKDLQKLRKERSLHPHLYFDSI